MRLCEDYTADLNLLAMRIGVGRSYDAIERHISVAGEDVTFFYIDGFIKDAELQRIMQQLGSYTEMPTLDRLLSSLAYVEVGEKNDIDDIVAAVLSGQTAILSRSFSGAAILVDARSYPARSTAEPDADRVMMGSRDGFVETLVMNTVLLRRRIRDPALIMEHHTIGTSSRTDVVLSYMEGVASERLVTDIKKRLSEIRTRALPLGVESLAECLIPRGWLNPFPKIRTTERPDTASAQVLEGSVIIFVDTCPQAIILPTSIFNYLEQTDDYCLPPLTGTYLRIVRTAILVLSLFVTPLWYVALENSALLPESLAFLIPDEPGAIPIICQLFLVEIAIDGLKIASMNTPDMLSSSLSVIGALILGDFAVSVGWVSEDVILYMAFVALANFAQQNAELGYAIKFVRVLTLLAVYFLGAWGLLVGLLIFVILVATNRTVGGRSCYLYPLIPFDPKALARLIFRVKKGDAD